MLRVIFLSLLLLAMADVNAATTAIVKGNPHGKVIITEFADYGCPHCYKMQPIVARFIKTHPDVKVRFVPVAVVGAISVPLTATALVVAETKTTFSLFDTIAWNVGVMHSQKLKDVWHEVGLNTQAQQLPLYSKHIQQQMRGNLRAFQAYGKGGVPLFVVSTNTMVQPIVLRGEQSEAALEEAYQHVR